MAKEAGKTTVLFSVDTKVKEKFEGTYKFKGLKKNEAAEEAMKLFTDKYIKETGKK